MVLKQRFAGFLFVIVLLFAFCSLPTLAIGADIRDFNDLVYENGVDTQIIEITPENVAERVGAYKAGAGTVNVSFDEASKMLTVAMTNAEIIRPLEVKDLNVTVDLTGENSITYYGPEYALIVKGNLKIKGADKAVDMLMVNGLHNAIYASGALTVENAKLKAQTGADATAASAYAFSGAEFIIYAGTDIAVLNSNLLIVCTSDWGSIGLWSDEGNIRIADSLVDIDGVSSDVIKSNGIIDIVDSSIIQSNDKKACGTVLSASGDIVIDNSQIDIDNCSSVVIQAGELNGEVQSEDEVQSSDIIMKNNSKIVISNTNTLEAGFACLAVGDIIIQNSTFDGASGATVLGTNGKLVIDNSSVEAESTKGACIEVKENLDIINSSKVNARGLLSGIVVSGNSFDKSNILIKDSRVLSHGSNAIINNNGDINIEGELTYVYGRNQSSDIERADFAETCYGIAALNGDINISGAQVGARVYNGYAMYANNITISGENTLMAVISYAEEVAGLAVKNALTVNGGMIAISSENNKGLETQGDITINGGEITIISRDCGIYAPNSKFKVTGGELEILTLADDAISVSDVEITGGDFLVKVPSGKKPLIVKSRPDFTAADLTGINFQIKYFDYEGDEPLACFLVTFFLDDGSIMKNTTAVTGEKLVAPEAPSKAGYIFDGWYAYGEKWDFENDVVTENLSLYAQYTKRSGGGSSGGGSSYYTLSFETNGGSSINKVQDKKGVTIKLADYTPTRKGYVFTGWYSDKELTKKITEIKLNGNKILYAGWTEQEINVETPEVGLTQTFADVKAGDWFFKDVEFVCANGLMNGASETAFAPNENTTRAQIAVIFYRLAGSPAAVGQNSFSDVEQGWYYDAATWAEQTGLMNGYENGNFAPDDFITREQLAAIFYRYAQTAGYDVTTKGALDSFADKDAVSAWAQNAMDWAVASGLMNGTGENQLDAQGTATRAQIAAMFHRFIGD